MKKRDELADPNSCMNKADNDEFVFVLRQKDPAIAATIRFWASERVRIGKNKADDPKILGALAEADEIDAKRSNHEQAQDSDGH